MAFEHGGHLLFPLGCDAAPDLVKIFPGIPCEDPVWKLADSHGLANHFATAFLLAELKGDSEAAAALQPEAVEFSGIRYQSEGCGAE